MSTTTSIDFGDQQPLSAAQAASEIDLSREIIARYCRSGEIPAVQLNPRTWLIARGDWERWKKAWKKRRAAAERRKSKADKG